MNTNQKDFGRILLPIITPFKKNEDVDYDTFKVLLNYLIENNCFDTLIVTGTTGEFNTLTFEERVNLFKLAVKVLDGKKPIIAGTGCGSTRETIALSKAAKECGIDNCMIVAPFYCKPTQEAIKEHYYAIANECDIDIILYNIPIFTGVNIEPLTLKELVKDNRFICIKDESGMNPVQLTEYYYAVKDINPDFLLINGDDIMLIPTIAQGVTAIVSGGAHLLSKEIRQVFELCDSGKLKEAVEIYRKIFLFCKINSINGRINPVPMLKSAIEMVTGIKVGKPRRPLNGISESEKELLSDTLKKIGLIK